MAIVDRRGITVGEAEPAASLYAHSGVAAKAAVVCTTTANITLSGLQTIDGVTVVADDRVLVKDQTDASENGIYNASSGTWQRAGDFDGAGEIAKGALIFVIGGTTQTTTYWYVTSDNPITIGESDINFSQPAFGDVSGPASATDENIVVFDGTTGKAVKDSGISIVDEDDLASDSATKVPTQQSVKAYADTKASASHNHAASDITSDTLAHERGGLEADVSAYSGLVKISGGSTSQAVADTDYQSVLAEGAFADGDKTKLDGIAAGADVVGPASATSGNVVIFNGTTGKLLSDSGASLSNYLPLTGGTLTGSIGVGAGASTGPVAVEFAPGRTGNGPTYTDFVGDATYTDHGLRIIRGGGGPNTFSSIVHRGTGNVNINAQDGGTVSLQVSSTAKLTATSTGIGVGTATPSTTLHVNGPARIGSYTVGTVPSASTAGAGSMIYVSDETGGAIPAFSDGTDWRRVSDRAVVS